MTAEFLSQLPERDPERLARLLEANARQYLRATAGREVETFHWFDGAILPMAVNQTRVLGELLIHSYDIARATGRRYQIPSRDALLLLTGLAPILPLAVDRGRARGLTASYTFGARGGPRVWLRFEDGRLITRRWTGQPVECHIRGDPVALILVLYGRIGQWGPIARGHLIAWGRRPWLALLFNRLFIKPGAPHPRPRSGAERSV